MADEIIHGLIQEDVKSLRAAIESLQETTERLRAEIERLRARLEIAAWMGDANDTV